MQGKKRTKASDKVYDLIYLSSPCPRTKQLKNAIAMQNLCISPVSFFFIFSLFFGPSLYFFL
ncbi:uncharacterized protein BDW70DRAFT_131319 [Aspergillus foveolatus]|uniref:uncharacterized protein n=1 Tax=Aspergillus foveolatus TaxID=210207 RepID=UPI003CCD3D49